MSLGPLCVIFSLTNYEHSHLKASGIGRMICRGCAVNGANTVLIDVNEKALADTKHEIESLGPGTKVLTLVRLHYFIQDAFN